MVEKGNYFIEDHKTNSNSAVHNQKQASISSNPLEKYEFQDSLHEKEEINFTPQYGERVVKSSSNDKETSPSNKLPHSMSPIQPIYNIMSQQELLKSQNFNQSSNFFGQGYVQSVQNFQQNRHKHLLYV